MLHFTANFILQTRDDPVSKFGEGDAEGLKLQFFLSQSYNISRNQPSKSVRRGDMNVFPFLALKKVCSIPTSLQIELECQNLVCQLD